MPRQGIMLCYPYDPRRLEKWGREAFIQLKLNGERCRAICLHNEVQMYSSEANQIPFLPHISQALLKLGLNGVELDGELYVHGFSLQDIHSIVSRKVNSHALSAAIEYHIFDIVEIIPQRDRFVQLRVIDSMIHRLGLSEILKVVQPELVKTDQEIEQFLDRAIDEGYEGFVIRNPNALYQRKRSTDVMKFKPHQEDVYEIVDSIEEVSIHGTPKGALGAIVCKGDDNTLFNVGTGFTRDDRQQLWKEREALVGKYLKVKFQTLSPGRRVPCHSVALQILDLKAEQ